MSLNYEFYDKINMIFEMWSILNENALPKLWNVDTDFMKTFERIYISIKDHKKIFDNVTELRVLAENNSSFCDGYQYKIFIGEIELICDKSKTGIYGKSTARQYFQALQWSNILMFDKFKKGESKNYQIAANFFQVIEDFAHLDMDMILEMIIYSIFNKREFVKNLGFTYFLCILNCFEIDYSNINREYFIVEKKFNKKAKDLKKQKIEKKRFDIRKKDFKTYIDKISKESCQTICKIFSNKSKEDFIENLYFYLSLKKNLEFIEKVHDSKIENKNLEADLKRERSRLKEEIINHRMKICLIKNRNDLYSDIVSMENGSMDGLEDKLENLDACHIKEHKLIKKEVMQSKLFEKIFETSNPSNGILMRNEYHRLFDKYYFSFNINGEMIYQKENEDYLFKKRNLKKIKINPILMKKSNVTKFLKTRRLV